MFDILWSPTINFTHGLLGSVAGGVFAWKIRRDSWRWILSFALLGLFVAVMVNYQTNIAVYQEIKYFLPVFTVLGALSGYFASHYFGSQPVRWTLGYALIGGSAAALSQMRHESLIFLPLGAVVALIFVLKGNGRIRWTVAFAGLGIVMGWLISSHRYYSLTTTAAIMIGSGAIAGMLAWFITREESRWIIAMASLVGASASFADFLLFTDWQVVVIGCSGGAIVGWLVNGALHRDKIAFLILGALGAWLLYALWMYSVFIDWVWNQLL